jgi:putative membrane-bound dehydrogenase-like protein
MRCLLLAILGFSLAGGSFGQGKFVGAAAAGAAGKPSPLGAEEELATFTLPPGFQIELVAAEPDIAKVVTVAFDESGKMWAITAVEYPVDENESPERARALFAGKGRDRVLVFDTPTARGRQKPRTFADGLAIPLGVLPMRDGVLVGHGHDLLLLKHTDGDGRADQSEVLLTGFGIQDSHLFPHQFTRGLGDWIYLAQGAFNYSKVKDKSGRVTPFDQTKLARFRPDGTRYEIVGWGLNNIWGFVIDRLGETFIQEANDLGYPVVPFFVGANYPGIGMHRAKPYAPWQPPLADFSMGGTGLSGLALSEDRDGFPPPYREVMYVANPITRQIQAVKIHREGTGFRLEKLPDFISSSDPWFRPVAIHFGPDSCLYIVDWYNKIISHNEVPRDHPERDKTRGRIWRVRHESMRPRAVPDLTRVAESKLLEHLGADCTWEARAARFQIIDRKAVKLAGGLKRMVETSSNGLDLRLNALWALEGLGKVELGTLQKLSKEGQRAARREAVRVLGDQHFTAEQIVSFVGRLVEDPDPQVRAEVIRTLDTMAEPGISADSRIAANRSADGLVSAFTNSDPIRADKAVRAPIELLVRAGKGRMEGPIVRPQQGGDEVHVGAAADRDFERYLARAALEKHPAALVGVLDSEGAKALPLENRVLAFLALGGKEGASRLAGSVSQLQRGLSWEELEALATHASAPGVEEVLGRLLEDPARQGSVLKALLKVKQLAPTHVGGYSVNDPALSPGLGSRIAAATKGLAARDASKENTTLMLRMAGSFGLRELEPEVVGCLTKTGQSEERKVAALRALQEMGAPQFALFQQMAVSGKPGDAVQREAVTALAAASEGRGVTLLLETWSVLPPALRKMAVDRLAGSRESAKVLLQAIKSGAVAREELDEYTVEKLAAVLGDEPLLAEIRASFAARVRPVLRLDGHQEDYADANIVLEGPFTVETWIRLDPGIDNHDGILGAPNQADFNFHDARFRVWDRGRQDVIIAKQAVQPETWTHVAVTRNPRGAFRIYLNGELDNEQGKRSLNEYRGLSIGRTLPGGGGTAARLAEFRVWNRERSGEEIHDAYKLSFKGEELPAGLVRYFAGDDWKKLNGQAKVIRTTDLPPLLSVAEARELNARFATYRSYAGMAGDASKGRQLFKTTCMVCHNVNGEGGSIGPSLNGASLRTTEELLRALLTPSAAVESGYYRYRVQMEDGDLLDGFLASQDDSTVVLRQPNAEDMRIPRSKIKRAGFTKTSMMPEGLLESMKPEEVAGLFAYLRTLK